MRCRDLIVLLLLASPAWAETTGQLIVVPPEGGGGSSIILDLADDGTNESTALAEVAVTGDTNAVFSEPSADKLLIDVSQAWPLADLAAQATALAANAANCSAGSYPLGVDASGAAEGCTADDDGTDDQIASEVPFTPAGGVAATDVQAAIEEVDAEHTVDTDTTCLDAGVSCLFAASVSEGGPATTATALAADGADCPAGSYPLGVSTTGAAQSCTDATTEIDSAIGTHASNANAHHTPTVDTGPSPDCSGTSTYQDGEGNCDAVGGDLSGGLDALVVVDEAVAATELADATDGSILTWDATGEAVLLAPGTNGQVLTTGGAGAAPTWEDAAAGASLTVEEADASPTVASVDTIQFDSADGFTVTDETGGNVQVDLLFAKLLDLDGDGTSEVGGTSGTNVLIDPLDGISPNNFRLRVASGGGGTGPAIGSDSNSHSNRITFGSGSGTNAWIDIYAENGFFARLDAAQYQTSASSTTTTYTWTGDLDTGLGRPTADEVRLLAGGVVGLGVTATEVDLYLIRDDAEQSVTCTDSGDGSAGALTITPSTSYVEITNSDAHGCVVTLSETGAAKGRTVEIVVISTAGGTVDFADTSGVTELAGAFTAGLYDSITLRYIADRWTESTRSDN